jgi:hypothetical protein
LPFGFLLINNFLGILLRCGFSSKQSLPITRGGALLMGCFAPLTVRALGFYTAGKITERADLFA